jgi:ABC-type antimicrobial peptide transport system permease subunit
VTAHQLHKLPDNRQSQPPASAGAVAGLSNSSLHLVIPGAEMALIVLGSYAASLLTTYLPAWQASRIYPAQALRYE